MHSARMKMRAVFNWVLMLMLNTWCLVVYLRDTYPSLSLSEPFSPSPALRRSNVSIANPSLLIPKPAPPQIIPCQKRHHYPPTPSPSPPKSPQSLTHSVLNTSSLIRTPSASNSSNPPFFPSPFSSSPSPSVGT